MRYSDEYYKQYRINPEYVPKYVYVNMMEKRITIFMKYDGGNLIALEFVLF